MSFFKDPCANPECDHQVRRGSKFCPKCGSPAPKGITTCGSCGKEVSTQSRFCWNCGTDLAAARPPQFTDDRWAREPSDFAIRVDDQDIKQWLVKPLIIEHGTRALLFQAGRFAGELNAGRYDLGGFLSRLANFMIDRAASIVLLEAGDVTLDLTHGNLRQDVAAGLRAGRSRAGGSDDRERGGLWTADPFELGAESRLVLRVVDPERVFVNLMKGRGRVTLEDLSRALADEVHMVLGGIVHQHRAEQLLESLEIRDEIEARLREHLAKTLERMGLALVQLRFIGFLGPAWEELRKGSAALRYEESRVDLDARRARLNQRLREVLTQEQMHKLKSGKDLEDFIRQVEHELGLKEVIRADEMERLTQRFEFERDREQLLRQLEKESIEDDHAHERAEKQRLADQHEHEQDMRQAEDGLGLLRQVADIEHEEKQREAELEHQKSRSKVELERQTLEQRSRATVEALLSIVGGPAAAQITELEKLRRQQGLSPEQILALTSGASADAARMLAEKYQAEGRLSQAVRAQLEQRIAEQREMGEKHADRVQWLTRIALEQMGAVAGARARLVEPRGPTVVASGAQRSTPPPRAAEADRLCRHCAAALEPGGAFCPECGEKQ